MFDIKPEHGHRMVMDGEPGVITSQDDFGVTDAGLIITETTITQFIGWDPDGKPEFVRSRKAMQYASSIDEYVAIIKEGNNGGYANDWLIGDRKTGEIAYLELGLKNTPLWRTKDGYFVSSNFPRDPALDQGRDRRLRYRTILHFDERPPRDLGAQDCREQRPDRCQPRTRNFSRITTTASPGRSGRSRAPSAATSMAIRREFLSGTTRRTIPMEPSQEKSPIPTLRQISR